MRRSFLFSCFLIFILVSFFSHEAYARTLNESINYLNQTYQDSKLTEDFIGLKRAIINFSSTYINATDKNSENFVDSSIVVFEMLYKLDFELRSNKNASVVKDLLLELSGNYTLMEDNIPRLMANQKEDAGKYVLSEVDNVMNKMHKQTLAGFIDDILFKDRTKLENERKRLREEWVNLSEERPYLEQQNKNLSGNYSNLTRRKNETVRRKNETEIQIGELNGEIKELKGKVWEYAKTAFMVSSLLGFIVGIVITYRWKREIDYYDVYTSSVKIRSPVTYAIIISLIIGVGLIIFLKFFGGLSVLYLPQFELFR